MQTNKKLEVLIATMHQTDFSLVEKMNLTCDAVFANQSGIESITNKTANGYDYKMITTQTKGVGANRNIAILYSKGDILLFSDDDCVYEDGALEKIALAFEELPKADVIVFGTKCSKNGEIFKVVKSKTGKLPFRKSMKFPTYAIAIRRESLLKYHLNFSQLFGGGCIYSCGEDSDFIIRCYKSKLKVYSYNLIICTTPKDISSWFAGYTEKYFYDKGIFARHSFGKMAVPYMMYIALKIKGIDGITFVKKLKYLRAGYKNFPRLLKYEDWKASVQIKKSGK